jgi:hypothetical protein
MECYLAGVEPETCENCNHERQVKPKIDRKERKREIDRRYQAKLREKAKNGK